MVFEGNRERSLFQVKLIQYHSTKKQENIPGDSEGLILQIWPCNFIQYKSDAIIY